MAKYIIREGQSIFDVAIQLYGDISYIYKIIEDNPTITDIHYENLRDLEVVYDVTSESKVKYFETNLININTDYPKTDNRQFDDSFDLSFT